MKTAASWLECPVCEYRFSVPPEYLDKSGKCPKCESVFQARDCQLPEKEARADHLAPEIPEPMFLQSVELDSADAEINLPPEPKPTVTKSSAGDESNNSTDTPELDYNQTYVAADKKKSDPNKVLLLVAGSCTLAIALLIGIPVAANLLVGKNDQGPAVEPGELNEVNSTPIHKKNKGPKKRNGNKRKKKKSVKSPIVRLTSADMKTIWEKCNSSVVLVLSKKGEKVETSHGAVVSDDGKIAVSWSHVEGAQSVRIKFASSEYGAESRWGPPVFAQSMINKSPELNLAIIQVDQKTIAAAARTSPISANERGVLPVLTNKASTDYLRQTKLNPAQPFSALSNAEQKTLTAANLTPAPNDYFTLHSSKVNKSGTGLPIFDDNGRLVGMHMSHLEATKSSFAIPVAPIKNLANDPIAKPVEFAVRSAADKIPSAKSGAPASQESGVPAAISSMDFGQSIQALEKLEWKITNQDAYQKIQRFSVNWWNINAEYPKADFTRRLEIEAQLKSLIESMDDSLFWPAKALRETINKSALEAFVKKEDGWFACVTVLKTAAFATEVDGEPAVLVDILETGSKALLVYGEVEGPFNQGTEWMVFGYNKNKTRLNTPDGKCLVIHVAAVKKR